MTLARDLDRLDRSPLNHLRLGMLGMVLRAVDLLDGDEELLNQHPFLGEYVADISRLTLGPVPKPADWRSVVKQWSKGHDSLPLERLRASGVSELGIETLIAVGFAEEDVRLCALFGDSRRLSLGAVHALCQSLERAGSSRSIGAEVAYLCAAGLVTLHNVEAPRSAWEYAVAPAVWDSLGGTVRLPAGLTLFQPEDLPDDPAFIPPRPDFPDISRIAAMLGERRPILSLRGPARNGRHLLAGCVMKALGRPMLSVDPQVIDDPAAWSIAGALACITGAGVVVEFMLGPGEDRILPAFPLGEPPLIIVSGLSGGLQSGNGRPVVTVDVPAPDPAARTALWRRAGAGPGAVAAELAHRFRLTSGNIVRAAEACLIRSNLEGSPDLAMGHVGPAIRSLHDSRIEAVARRVEPLGADEFISLDETALDELDALAVRCRHRERLATNANAPAGRVGVRALLAGPSGTGKTLCARWLAGQLDKDMYRLDLAASVSKYIGETEKVLDRAFAAAEDLDCILLIDEGDALMARRTEIGSANDRYANLETNFLLQRIESFDGILVVTTNAAERIDKAFSRRMDVVVQFRAPDELRRYEILDRHLGDHRASDWLLQEIACRCPLTGGQLHNVAQHARLLALHADDTISDSQLRAALLREYRKMDSHCPLKPHLAAAL